MGGDEFCVIVRGADSDRVLAAAAEALSEHGEHFDVRCSSGSVVIGPNEMTLEQALLQADQRLYSNKRSSRGHAGGEAHDVLLSVLAEHSLSLATHLSHVGTLAEAVARKLGLSEDAVLLTRLTAELHDVGKTAIPDAILDKPGPLDDDEWALMKRHTIIGERILAAAPALARVAPLVRSTHERVDGAGYLDGLVGDAIPLSSHRVRYRRVRRDDEQAARTASSARLMRRSPSCSAAPAASSTRRSSRRSSRSAARALARRTRSRHATQRGPPQRLAGA